jgi:hypothetical protein
MKTNFNKRLPGNPVSQLPIEYSVQFGDPKRDYNMKAYPFWYNFVKSPYQVGNMDAFGANQDVGIYRVTSVDSEGPDGLTLVSGGILDIPIVMDNDTNFHMLYTKYGAFRITNFTVVTTDAGDTFAQPLTDPVVTGDRIVIDTLTTTTGPVVGISYFVIAAGATTFQISLTSGGAAITLTDNGTAAIRVLGGVNGSREYLLFPFVNDAPAAPGQGLLPLVLEGQRIAYWTELDVSLYMPSSMNRDIYGGFQRQPIGGATEEAPIPILDLQGKQDGLGMLKTAFQLTKSATVWIRIRSRSAFPLQVYGHVFGYKITG